MKALNSTSLVPVLVLCGISFLMMGASFASASSSDLSLKQVQNEFADSNPMQFPDLQQGRYWQCNRFEALGPEAAPSEVWNLSFTYTGKKILQSRRDQAQLVFVLENGERLAREEAESNVTSVLRSSQDGNLIIEISTAAKNLSEKQKGQRVIDAVAVYGDVAVAYIYCSASKVTDKIKE